jgi:hypothetical protein
MITKLKKKGDAVQEIFRLMSHLKGRIAIRDLSLTTAFDNAVLNQKEAY